MIEIFISPQSVTILKSYASTKVASKYVKKRKIDNRTTEETDISTRITWHSNTLSQLLAGQADKLLNMSAWPLVETWNNTTELN